MNVFSFLFHCGLNMVVLTLAVLGIFHFDDAREAITWRPDGPDCE